MNTVQKTVLVPYEKYQRLTRATGSLSTTTGHNPQQDAITPFTQTIRNATFAIRKRKGEGKTSNIGPPGVPDRKIKRSKKQERKKWINV